MGHGEAPVGEPRDQHARASDALFRAVLESAPDAILMADENGRIVLVNGQTERIFGYARHELVGAPVDLLLPERLRRVHEQHRSGYHADPRTRPMGVGLDLAARRKDGTEFPAEISLSPVETPGGQLVAAIIRDVSERRRIEQQRAEAERARTEAETANRAKDEFLAMLGHELRNPLAAIISALSVLNTLAPGDEATTRARAVIDRQVRHLARLVDDLLDVARVATGKITVHRERLDLGDVVARCAEIVRKTSRQTRHVISVTTTPLWIEADDTRVEQIVMNLLNNAVRFTPHGGRISVAVEEEDAHAVVRIVDTGRGIPAAILPRIFDLFVQADVTIDRARGGLGLGLTLVRRLVELLGGTVVASSEGEGRGATFTVRLPRVSPPAADPARGHEVRPPVAARRVLIIEDNDDAREMLRRVLEIAGHEVYDAPDGPSGLAQVAAHAINVVIVDIGLPDMDGYEVARRIRAAKGAHVHLIALTGYGQPEDRRRSEAAGFDAHLVKPVTSDELERVLAESPAA